MPAGPSRYSALLTRPDRTRNDPADCGVVPYHIRRLRNSARMGAPAPQTRLSCVPTSCVPTPGRVGRAGLDACPETYPAGTPAKLETRAIRVSSGTLGSIPRGISRDLWAGPRTGPPDRHRLTYVSLLRQKPRVGVVLIADMRLV